MSMKIYKIYNMLCGLCMIAKYDDIVNGGEVSSFVTDDVYL